MRRIVHEMRNHLAVAMSNIEAFLDGKLEPTQARLTAVLHALTEVDVLINDLPRTEAGPLELHEQSIDVCNLIANESTAMEGFASERGVRFSVERCACVDAACANFYGDPQRIGQVVTNVLTNAIRYTPRGGSVGVVCRRDGGYLEFTVNDDGPGIAPDDLPRIFEPGFRGKSAGEHHGSGLGLSLVKEFVERQGGSVHVRSTPTSGATFTVRLPGTPVTSGPGACDGSCAVPTTR
jgi:signal transduction histidine kinase